MFPLANSALSERIRARVHGVLDVAVEFSTLGEYRLSEALVPVPAAAPAAAGPGGEAGLGGPPRERRSRRSAARARGHRCEPWPPLTLRLSR